MLKICYDSKDKTMFFSFFQKEILVSFKNRCAIMLEVITHSCEQIGKQESSEWEKELVLLKVVSN